MGNFTFPLTAVAFTAMIVLFGCQEQPEQSNSEVKRVAQPEQPLLSHLKLESTIQSRRKDS